jgi:hypothetical protein
MVIIPKLYKFNVLNYRTLKLILPGTTKYELVRPSKNYPKKNLHFQTPKELIINFSTI